MISDLPMRLSEIGTPPTDQQPNDDSIEDRQQVRLDWKDLFR